MKKDNAQSSTKSGSLKLAQVGVHRPALAVLLELPENVMVQEQLVYIWK